MPLRCLRSSGIRQQDIARAANLSPQTLYNIEHRKYQRVQAHTARKIERVHWALWLRHGPFRRRCGCELPAWVLDELEEL